MAEVPSYVLHRVRLVCLDLPEVEEEQAWVGVRWVVARKNFAHLLMIDGGQARRGKDAWSDTSPSALAPLSVPVTLVSAVYDPIVPPAHARRLAQAASGKGGAAVDLLNLDDAGHFELIAPWTAAGAATVTAILSR